MTAASAAAWACSRASLATSTWWARSTSAKRASAYVSVAVWSAFTSLSWRPVNDANPGRETSASLGSSWAASAPGPVGAFVVDDTDVGSVAGRHRSSSSCPREAPSQSDPAPASSWSSCREPASRGGRVGRRNRRRRRVGSRNGRGRRLDHLARRGQAGQAGQDHERQGQPGEDGDEHHRPAGSRATPTFKTPHCANPPPAPSPQSAVVSFDQRAPADLVPGRFSSIARRHAAHVLWHDHGSPQAGGGTGQSAAADPGRGETILVSVLAWLRQEGARRADSAPRSAPR